jgi:carbon monoxide dehydrogenase subunit G
VKINNEFTVHTPIDRAWAVLTDLEGIAPCLPGAQLTGVDGDVYRGKVKVKVGPVISEFSGTARFVEKDDAGHRAVIDAKGRDARSAGNAAALITAELRPDGDATVVTVDTDLKISGKLAQFGSGMIKEVSGKLLGQFVTALEAKIAGGDGGAPAEPAAAGAGAGGPAGLEPAGPPTGAPAEPAPAAAPEPANTSAAVAGPGGEATAFATDVEPGFTATTEVGGPAAAVAPGTRVPENEPEPLDLLEVAGGSIRKRLMPLAIGVAVVAAAVVVYRIARR